VESVPGVGHVTIEKNLVMQQKVIGAIDSVVFGRRAPVLVTPGAPLPPRQRAASAAPAAAAATR
jgi:hypothetical protein